MVEPIRFELRDDVSDVAILLEDRGLDVRLRVHDVESGLGIEDARVFVGQGRSRGQARSREDGWLVLSGRREWIDDTPVERLRERRRDLRACCAHHEFRGKILRERLQLPPGNRESQKCRRDLGKLMRFVDHDCIRTGQQISESFFLQHEVSHEQVVIHHDDVSRLRFTPRQTSSGVSPPSAR